MSLRKEHNFHLKMSWLVLLATINEEKCIGLRMRCVLYVKALFKSQLKWGEKGNTLYIYICINQSNPIDDIKNKIKNINM